MNEPTARTLKYALARLFFQEAYYGEGKPWNTAPNGWSSSSARRLAYSAYLPHLDRAGNLVDLGCGDGSLLKFLLLHAEVSLQPFGVDFLETSIDAAKTVVLPEFEKNFFTANVAEFDVALLAPDYILINPFYLLPEDRLNGLSDLFSKLNPGGKLLLYEYRGAPGFEKINDLRDALGLPEPRFLSSPWTSLLVYEK